MFREQIRPPAFPRVLTSCAEEKNPTGIPSQSPGLRAARYPGSTSLKDPNPERVAPRPNAANTNPKLRRSDMFIDQPAQEVPSPVGAACPPCFRRQLNGRAEPCRLYGAWDV